MKLQMEWARGVVDAYFRYTMARSIIFAWFTICIRCIEIYWFYIQWIGLCLNDLVVWFKIACHTAKTLWNGWNYRVFCSQQLQLTMSFSRMHKFSTQLHCEHSAINRNEVFIQRSNNRCVLNFHFLGDAGVVCSFTVKLHTMQRTACRIHFTESQVHKWIFII